MKKQLLKTMLVSLITLMASNAWADEVTATLTHTASSSCAGDATAYTSTVDAEKEHVNNAAFDGKSAWQGAAYADFSFVIPEGAVVTKATLTYHIFGESRRDRDCGIYYVNAGEQLDYAVLAGGKAMVNLPATQIGTMTFDKNGNNVEKTQDVSNAVKAIVAAGQSNIIFKWTGNPGGGDLAGKGLETAPTLVIQMVSAELQTHFTVKFVDQSGNPIKDAVMYDGISGEPAEAPAKDKVNFYTEDGSKKYIFVSGGDAITLVNDDASNVITLTFREAATFNYTVNFACSELILGSKTGAVFEGDDASVAYPKYLAYEDGQLYTKGATNKEYNFKFTPAANAETQTLEYTAVEGVDNVVFITEGEDVEDLTPCTSANTGVRSSNSASAYAAYDTKIAVLTPGTYKLHAITYDASKEPNSHFVFMAGENQIADFNCTVINIQEFDSEEFTVEETCDLVLKAVGGASIGLDALYITSNGKAIVKDQLVKAVELAMLFDVETTDAQALLANPEATLKQLSDALMSLAGTIAPKAVETLGLAEKFFSIFDNNAGAALAPYFTAAKEALAGTDFDAIYAAVKALFAQGLIEGKDAMAKVKNYLEKMGNEKVNADLADFAVAIATNNSQDFITAFGMLKNDLPAAAQAYIGDVSTMIGEGKIAGKDVSGMETALTNVILAYAQNKDFVDLGYALYNLIKAVEAYKEANAASPYYLVGTMTNWALDGVKEEYNLTLNKEAQGVEEYMITLDLEAGAEFKIVKNGETLTWYPDVENSNFVINDAGNYTVYFRPNGDGGQDWHYGVIFAVNNPATGLSFVNADTQSAVVYNLKGQRVVKAQKGLYIVNGKKVILK